MLTQADFPQLKIQIFGEISLSPERKVLKSWSQTRGVDTDILALGSKTNLSRLPTGERYYIFHVSRGRKIIIARQ